MILPAPPSPRNAWGKPQQSRRSGGWRGPRFRLDRQLGRPKQPPATLNRRAPNRCRPGRPLLPPRPLLLRPQLQVARRSRGRTDRMGPQLPVKLITQQPRVRRWCAGPALHGPIVLRRGSPKGPPGPKRGAGRAPSTAPTPDDTHVSLPKTVPAQGCLPRGETTACSRSSTQTHAYGQLQRRVVQDGQKGNTEGAVEDTMIVRGGARSAHAQGREWRANEEMCQAEDGGRQVPGTRKGTSSCGAGRRQGKARARAAAGGGGTGASEGQRPRQQRRRTGTQERQGHGRRRGGNGHGKGHGKGSGQEGAHRRKRHEARQGCGGKEGGNDAGHCVQGERGPRAGGDGEGKGHHPQGKGA